MKPKPEAKIRSQREIDAFWNYVFFGAFLAFALLVLALSCVGASADTRTVYIRGGDEDVSVQELVDEFVVAGESMNYAARLTKSATLTVSEHNGLETWQENNLPFYAYHDPVDGSWTLKSIAERSTVAPVLTGNRVTFPAIFTVPGGNIDLEYAFTTNRVLKTYRFSGAAAAILPSPTSVDFFPGADLANLYFAIGANPMVYEASSGVTAEMDDIPIDLADDQVIGDKFVMKVGGGFLHEFLPPYAGMEKGQHLYLGDLQCYFAVWTWNVAKNESEFDPSYTFQDATYITDTRVYEGAPTTNYHTEIVTYVRSDAGARQYTIINLDIPAIAAAYNIRTTTAGSKKLSNISFSFTADGTTSPTSGDIYVNRVNKAGLISTLTWNLLGSYYYQLFQQHVNGITAGVVTSTTGDLLTSARACIAGSTYFQIALTPTASWTGTNPYFGLHSEDAVSQSDRPLFSLTLTDLGGPYTADNAWINSSTVYITSSVLPVGAEFINSTYNYAFFGGDSALIPSGTSSSVTESMNPSRYISQIYLPVELQSSNNIGLYWRETINDSSGVIALVNAVGGSGSSTDYSAEFLHLNESIEDATGSIATASASIIAQVDANETKIDANNAAIVANNVLLHEVDFRAKEIQKDTAAGGQVIPASGIAALNFNANITQENAWDIQLYGQSKTSNEPNLSFWITHGKVPTSSKTYKVATLGDSITYIGAYDSKADAAAIGGASVYTHIYTTHFTPADATGVYHVAGVCSDGTCAWSIGGDFVFGATPSLTLNDQLTATAFNARADQWDTMLDALAAGEIYACTIYRAAAAISRTTAGVNIDEATDSVYVPLEGVYGYERSFTKTDGTTTTRRWLLDHDEGSTNGERSKVREIGADYPIQTWAAAQGHSITWSGGSYTP